MPYAIMRFEKRKGGPASALERHHERKKEKNEDVLETVKNVLIGLKGLIEA